MLALVAPGSARAARGQTGAQLVERWPMARQLVRDVGGQNLAAARIN
jgi:hypothetical protein